MGTVQDYKNLIRDFNVHQLDAELTRLQHVRGTLAQTIARLEAPAPDIDLDVTGDDPELLIDAIQRRSAHLAGGEALATARQLQNDNEGKIRAIVATKDALAKRQMTREALDHIVANADLIREFADFCRAQEELTVRRGIPAQFPIGGGQAGQFEHLLTRLS